MWCGLEFSQNYNHTVPHFCSHMCSVVYMIWFKQFEVGIFFKFRVFYAQLKTNFFPLFWVKF